MRGKSLGALVALLGCLAIVVAVPASGGDSNDATATYIVQLVQAPVATYGGEISGYAATRPGKGKKVDTSTAEAQNYAGYLRGKHDEALNRVGGAAKIYDYTSVFNGFAAKLTTEQASKLEGMKDIVTVEKAENVRVDGTSAGATTGSSDQFLGLSKPGGLWDQLGGLNKGSAGSGAG
jgi:hypothetical protein